MKTGRESFLARLAGVTGVVVVAAIVSILLQNNSTAPLFEARLAFPDLDQRLGDVTSLKVTSAQGALTLDILQSGNWVVRERNNYPAKVSSVRRLALGLADLELMEAKTARPDWHEHLGLSSPETGGEGTRFQALDSEGDVLADLIAGSEVGLPDLNGSTFRYVRLGQEDLSYLARGALDLGTDFDFWADLDVLVFERERLMRVTSGPGKAGLGTQAFSAARATPEIYNFDLENVPLGYEPTSPGIANGVGSALASITFLDVLPEKKIDFAEANHLNFETFDGLIVDVWLARPDGVYWIKFSVADGRRPVPENAPDNESGRALTRQASISAMNARGIGWAFQVPNWKGDQMAMAFDSMIKVIGEIDE